jgi:hypothetical protein
LRVLSQKGGDVLVFQVNSSLANLVSGAGAKQMTLASAALQGQAQVAGMEKYSGNFAITNLAMLDKKTRKPTAPLEVGLEFDMTFGTNKVLDIRSTALTLTPTARAKNLVNLTGRIDMANSEAMTGTLALTADTLDFTRYFDMFYHETAAADGGAGGPAEPEIEPEPMDLPLTNFTANARIGMVYLREMVMSNVVSSVSVNGPKVAIKPMEMALNGAPMSGAVLLDLGVPGFKYDVNFKAVEVPFAPLVNTFLPDRRDQIGGTISAQGAVAGIGSTGPNLQKHLAGNFDIATTNLNLALNNVKSPLLKTVIRVIAMVPELRSDPGAAMGSLAGSLLGGSSSKPGGWSDELSRSPIDVIELKGAMGSGKIDLARAFLQSPAFQVDASGPITLAAVTTNSTLHLPLNIAVARPLAEKIKFVPAGTPTNALYVQLPNYVAVKGKVGEPSTDINKKALLGSVLEQYGGKIPGVDQKTGGLIQGLGGLLSGRKPAATETNVSSGTNQPAATNQPVVPGTNPPASPAKTNPPSASDLLNQILRPKK